MKNTLKKYNIKCGINDECKFLEMLLSSFS